MENANYGEAVELLENYPEDNSLSTYARYLLSKALMEAGNYERGLDVLEPIPAGNGDAPLRYEKYFLRARILNEMGRSERALRVAGEAHGYALTAREKEELAQLEFAIASEASSPQRALREGIEYCEATRLRFIGEERDRLFEKIENLVDRADFSDGQGLEYLYSYIEILIDYGEYRRARSHLLRNMGNWEGSLRSKAYFTLAWLDGFKLDFPEEARWTFSRLFKTNQNSWAEAKGRYYLALFKGRNGENYDLVEGLLDVYRRFPETTYGKLAARRAFQERTKGAGLSKLDNQLEVFKSYLSRSTVREATWELFYQSYAAENYSLALHYLSKLESFYEEVPPEIVFWRYKTRASSEEDSGSYLKLVGSQKEHPINYYSLLASEKGWSRGGFDLEETWDATEIDLTEREAEILNKDISSTTEEKLRTAIRLKNHDLYRAGLGRLERIKPELPRQDFLFLKSQWESLAGEYMDSIKTSNRLLDWFYERNRVPPLAVVKTAFPTYYGDEVKRIAGQFGVPPSLVFAVIRQESAFNARAYSTSGAQGLMQVMPATAKGIAVDLKMDDYSPGDSFRPETNIRMGSYYISKQASSWGDIRLGLTAYHGGPGNLGDWRSQYDSTDLDLFLEKIPAGSTRNYVKAVYRNYLVYEELLSG